MIPTNMPMVRTDNPDKIYRTEKEKYDAVIEEIRELHKQRRPSSSAPSPSSKSEKLAMLSRHGGQA